MVQLKEFFALWPVHWLIVLLFIFVLKKILGKETIEIIRIIVSEFRDLAARRINHRSIDALAIVAVLLIGIVLVVSAEAGEIVSLFGIFGAAAQGHEFQEAAHPEFLVLILALTAMFSLWITSDK